MPLLERPARSAPKLNVGLRLDREMLTMLDEYCKFLESTRQYVIEASLRYTFEHDHEFQTWLAREKAKGKSA